MKPRKAYHAIVKSVIEEEARADSDQLAPDKKIVARVAHFYAEVFNGGYAQFLTNSRGRLVHDVLKDLQILGCTSQRDLLQQLVARLETDGVDPTDRNQVGQHLFGDNKNHQFEQELNNSYCQTMDSFYEGVLAFVFARKEVFEIG